MDLKFLNPSKSYNVSGLPKKMFPRPQGGTNAPPKNDIFKQMFQKKNLPGT